MDISEADRYIFDEDNDEAIKPALFKEIKLILIVQYAYTCIVDT